MRTPARLVCAALVCAGVSLSAGAPGAVASTRDRSETPLAHFDQDLGALKAPVLHFETVAASWMNGNGTRRRTVLAAARPVERAIVTFDHQLSAQHWPSDAREAVTAVEHASAHLGGNLATLCRKKDLSAVETVAPLVVDRQILSVSIKTLEHDLSHHSATKDG